jgi:hypothetical protein
VYPFDSGKEDDAFTAGPMGAYLKAVLLSFRAADSTPTNFDDFDPWLTKELRENGFWLRKERAKLVYYKLKIEFGEPLFTIGTSGFGYMEVAADLAEMA